MNNDGWWDGGLFSGSSTIVRYEAHLINRSELSLVLSFPVVYQTRSVHSERLLTIVVVLSQQGSGL